jgi:c-di-GMP-binding flagellar brake protein YcgR
MAAWLSKMLGSLGSAPDVRTSPRQVLLIAQRGRLKVALEPLNSTTQATVLNTSIEQVREDDLVVSQPTIGGLTHPLAFGEELRLSFYNQNTHHIAQTRCLGRVKIPTGGNQTLFAYRLEMPPTIRSEDRRQNPRIDLPLDLTCEAHLYAPGCDGPLLGTMVDISMGGARIRTLMASDKIQQGLEIYLKALLPEPVGLLDEMVRVVRMEIDENTGEATVGVAFGKRIDGLAELIRFAQSHGSRRQAG